MIVYENSEIDLQAENYNQTYTRENQQLSERYILEAIDRLLPQNGFLPASCLDLSCGQGKIIASIADKAKMQASHFDGRRFVGLDIDKAAIDQCEASYPDLSWIVDSYRIFTESGAFERLFNAGVDLIVNKSGFTATYSEEEYAMALEYAKSHLTEDGRYLFVANRRPFIRWSNAKAKAWKRDPLQIVFDVFGEPENHSNQSFYFLLFAKNPKTALPYPRSVNFTFDDGSTSERDIYFDPLLRERITTFREDRPRVETLMIDMRLSVSPDFAVSVTKKLYEADPSFQMVQGRTGSSKAYRQGTHDLNSPAADKIVLGGSFSDWLIDSKTGQPTVDLDEFYVSCDFIFSKLRTSGAAQLIYLTAFPRTKGKDKQGFVYSPNIARPYRDALHELSKQYDVAFHDLTDVGPDPTENGKSRWAWSAAVVQAAKEAIQ